MATKLLQLFCQSWLWLSLIVFTSSLTSRPLMAQVVDSVQAQISPQEVEPLPSPSPVPSPELPQPLPPPEELLPPPQQTPTPPEVLPGEPNQTITVERFEVIGSTVFSPERLASVLAPYTNRPISLAELFQARSAITQLYNDQGYITSGAYIPPQTLQGGVVTIQVVEGSLEDIQVTGTRRLNPNYVRSRIAVANSGPLNRNRLLESLQLLQLNALIENVSAELTSGSRPAASVLEVRVTEAKSDSTQIVLDNGRVPSVGSFRRRLQATEANLLGQGDSLSLAYTNTDGSNALDSSYVWPLNPRNGTLSLNYGTTDSDVIEPPFDRLDINSDSRYYELTLRQPLLQTPTREFSIGLTASRRESETELLGIPFALALGADDEGRTRISALRFFQEWTQRDSREVIAARSQFSIGTGAFDATTNESGPDSRFVAWQGQAQWVRLLAQDTLLLLRAGVQVADSALLTLEQFSLGGLASVRGYRQDFILSDNGVFASAEIRLPILRASEIDGVLQVAPFVDLGTAWNNSGRPDLEDENTLASVGFGLVWQQSDRFNARVDWGIPLVDVDQRERTWQENGVYFSVQYFPF